jgi:bifunctional DNA-binding transcriptional regulator/antitoxin component of YhaV-PrlF toxin-antitoxin module
MATNSEVRDVVKAQERDGHRSATIPRAIAEEKDIGQGDVLLVEDRGDEIVFTPIK